MFPASLFSPTFPTFLMEMNFLEKEITSEKVALKLLYIDLGDASVLGHVLGFQFPSPGFPRERDFV